MRSLLFTLWLKSNKSVAATLELIKDLTLAQMDSIEQGGAKMINASVGGKSFSYQLPKNWGEADFRDQLMLAYKTIETGGATGARMTEAELQAFVLDINNEVTDTIVARINYNNYRR